MASKTATSSKIPPSAAATAGWRLTWSRIDAGSVGVVPPSFVTSWRGVTATSVPLFEATKILSNDALIVSVNTYVPAMSVTPSATASAVSARRSLREQSPRRTTAHA